MTMAQLAALAGVSVSTVSKAFSGSNEISEEKREHIFKIARKEGCYDKYTKNPYNRNVIAVICPEFKSRLYSEQLSLLESEIKKRDATMIVSCTDFNYEREEELLTFFSEYSKVVVIIVYGMHSEKEFSLPIVSMSETHNNCDSVHVSSETAVTEAIKHFKEYGHRDIAFIGETLTVSKQDTFKKAMQKNKLTINDEYIIEGKGRFESAGYTAMNKLFELKKPPTAILAAYDDIAIGAMKSIYEHGLKIPEDISIIGMDNIKETPYLSVPLTSITSYNEDLCQIAVDMLFEKIKCRKLIKNIKLSRELIKRGSVGKVKKTE